METCGFCGKDIEANDQDVWVDSTGNIHCSNSDRHIPALDREEVRQLVEGDR